MWWAGGAAGKVESGEMVRDAVDLREGEGAAVDHRADIARQRHMNPGERRHGARAADHLDAARADMAADVVAGGTKKGRSISYEV